MNHWALGLKFSRVGGAGKSQPLLYNQQPECGLRELEKAVCSHPLSNNWTSCSPWQGNGDFKGSKEPASFPHHPVSSGLLHWPPSLPLALTCHPTLREQRRKMYWWIGVMNPPYHEENDSGCIVLPLDQGSTFQCKPVQSGAWLTWMGMH